MIPSKIFEAMAMERPIIMGVQGESLAIVEAAGCGVAIEPENEDDLVGAVLRLCEDRVFSESLGKSGRRFVEKNYSREVLAGNYLQVLLKQVDL